MSELTPLTPLTPRQVKAIAALMTCGNVTAAAKLAGVSRRALTYWLRDARFCSELRAAQDDAIASARRVMAGASADAAELLADTVRGPAPMALRLAAARELLRHVTGIDLAARVEKLEDELNQDQGPGT